MAHRWNDVGLALRLCPYTLETIKSDCQDSKSCLCEVLTEWLKKSYDTNRFGQPSWRLLVRAVAHPYGGNDRALAEQIAARHNGKCRGNVVRINFLFRLYKRYMCIHFCSLFYPFSASPSSPVMSGHITSSGTLRLPSPHSLALLLPFSLHLVPPPPPLS